MSDGQASLPTREASLRKQLVFKLETLLVTTVTDFSINPLAHARIERLLEKSVTSVTLHSKWEEKAEKTRQKCQ
jgi:hypothetical protein